MKSVTSIISQNLKKIRKEREISLQQLSELSGVSKSMLGEIDRGMANPTITVMWKIARGLQIPFTALLHEDKEPVEVVLRRNMEGIVQGEGYDVYSLFSFEEDRKFEIFMEEIGPGSSYETQGHNPGVEEYIMLGSGKLEILFQNSSYLLEEGESMRFKSDQPHGYKNPGNDPARVFFILFYFGKQ